MNILILTPDAVGSTLLQRLITIYMQFYEFDRPVINLHELTNGLNLYYSPEFNRELLGKNGEWGYHQTLEEIVGLLRSVDHYKTARLAEYHLISRRDSQSDCLSFYQYLNENFYIISCRRQNLLEYALSWCINNITKKLNVYNHAEKIQTFSDLYSNRFVVPTDRLVHHLERYLSYIRWVDDYFSVGINFYYEQHVPTIEKFILDLPIFQRKNQALTWKTQFGIDFVDYNRCHFLSSDISRLNHVPALGYDNTTDQLNLSDRDQISSLLPWLPEKTQTYVSQHINSYIQVQDTVLKMQELGILPGTIPIKKQTFEQKKLLIKNYDECVQVYNDWIVQHPELGQPTNSNDLNQQQLCETEFWKPQLLLTQ